MDLKKNLACIEAVALALNLTIYLLLHQVILISTYYIYYYIIIKFSFPGTY